MISDQLILKPKEEAANNLLADKNYQSASPDIQKKLMDAANLAVDQRYGIGSTYWTAATAISGALAGLAGGNGGAVLAGGLAPYLSEAVKIATTKEGEVNIPANLAGHALAGALIAYLQGGSLSAGAVGGAGGEAAARVISAELYPGIKAADLTNEQKANISALSTLAAGLAGGVLNDSSMAGVQAAAAGKVAVENNALGGLDGFGKGMADYVQAQGSLVNNTNLTDENGKILNPATPEQIKYASDKLVTGELPEGANITKVIVNGYKDGVLIAGAAYLGPAASVGKVVGGAVIAEIANGTYQWFDLSRPGNENKTWDYWGSISTGITGALAPGRGVWQNVGIAAGGAVFTDGPDIGSVGGAALGAWAGGKFGELAPFPGEVNDLFGGIGGEIISNKVKDKINEN